MSFLFCPRCGGEALCYETVEQIFLCSKCRNWFQIKDAGPVHPGEEPLPTPLFQEVQVIELDKLASDNAWQEKAVDHGA